MGQTTAILMGATICCVVPLLSFLAGAYIGKYGMPLAIRWRGLRPGEDEDID